MNEEFLISIKLRGIVNFICFGRESELQRANDSNKMVNALGAANVRTSRFVKTLTIEVVQVLDPGS